MSFVSTRGASPPASLGDAVAAGLAPDGGLYVPASLAPLGADACVALRGADFHAVAAACAPALFGPDIPPSSLAALLADALDFPMPLVEVEPGVWALELFHGPTHAFKDVGARTMARLLARFHAGGTPFTVLVATSGDTGGAVAQAFHGLPGTRVVVLYPDGQVTPVQEAQFTTLGGNVTAVAVAGTFDDCQRLVKEAFGDPALAARARLTSANSINIGRLLPQALYYAWAALQFDEPPVVSVPSGNFGNLTAGLLAHRLGVPIAGFVAATGANDVVPKYLATGRFEAQPSRRTVANAMDVGNPSNLERMRWLVNEDVGRLRALVAGSVHADAEVVATIRDLLERRGYLCDPHSAIGYLGATRAPVHPGTRAPRVFLATAHPAKFRDVVEPAIGRAVPLPPALADALARDRSIVRMPPDLAALAAVITA
ncbi:MAG: threonine synthase [Acidobacteriota bacterium]